PEFQLAKLPAINGPALAKRMSFGEFIESDHPFLRDYLDDFHTRQIVRSGWDWWKCDDKDLDIAVKRVESMDWFYVCELPMVSMAWLKAVFPQVKFPPELSRMNETPKDLEVTATWKQVGVVLQRNRHDMELYGTALRVLQQKSRLAVHS
ncbi:MAG: hypothetical protein ACKO26_00135, partial [Planctomycetota bacterium]